MNDCKVSFMRLLLFFDLPVETGPQKRNYRQFIKFLKTEGYIRMQYSVYSKLCINSNAADTAAKKARSSCPSDGDIRFLVITEGQYQKIVNVNDTYSLQEKVTNTSRTIIIGGMNNESGK